MADRFNFQDLFLDICKNIIEVSVRRNFVLVFNY